MPLSVFDLYSVGIGPSSSHTVGPMRAAGRFVSRLAEDGLLGGVARVRAELFGSLAATGRGHHSDRAVVLGLEGEDPATVDPRAAGDRFAEVVERQELRLAGKKTIPFSDGDLVLHLGETLPEHPNGMRFTASGEPLCSGTYYSVGGGFVVAEGETGDVAENGRRSVTRSPPPPNCWRRRRPNVFPSVR